MMLKSLPMYLNEELMFFLFFFLVYMLTSALMLMHSAAEPLFFHINRKLTWDEAKDNCQVKHIQKEPETLN